MYQDLTDADYSEPSGAWKWISIGNDFENRTEKEVMILLQAVLAFFVILPAVSSSVLGSKGMFILFHLL